MGFYFNNDSITPTKGGSGGGGSAVIEELNITPSTSSQTITAPSGTDGYSPVNVSAVTASIDANIQAGNIKKNVTILGVTGSLESGGGSSLTATNTTGSAITAGDKVWITPNGNSYDIVNLTKLQANFEIVGNPTIDYETGIVSNMDASNYIHVEKFLNTKYVEMYIKMCPTEYIQGSGVNIVKSVESDGSAIYIRADVHKIAMYDGINAHQNYMGQDAISLNQWTWVYVKAYKDSQLHVLCKTLVGPNYTLDTLPAITNANWREQFNANGYGFGEYKFNIGHYEGPFIGSIDLKNTIIKNGTGADSILWQPFEEVSNLTSNSFSGYAAENIASGSSGQVSVILSA